MIFACWRAGLPLRVRRPRRSPPVRELGRLLVPGVIGSSAAQVNIAVDIILASLLPTGSVSYLFFADRLVQLPLGAVGVAVGTALLPLLARQLTAGDENGAMHSLNRAIELVLLLCVPAAVALMIAAQPIVEVLFEREAFTAASTAATAAAAVAFAAGLPAYVLVKALSPSFFARKDTRTPVVVAAVALGLNIVLNLVLMIPLRHVGLALATAISAWVNALALGVILRRRGHLTFDARLIRAVVRGALAAAAMGAALWAFVHYAPAGVFDGDGLSQWLGLAALVALGLAVYGLALQLLNVATLGDLRRMARPGRG
jgi:putative peptidoglycan lipid II flippase